MLDPDWINKLQADQVAAALESSDVPLTLRSLRFYASSRVWRYYDPRGKVAWSHARHNRTVSLGIAYSFCSGDSAARTKFVTNYRLDLGPVQTRLARVQCE